MNHGHEHSIDERWLLPQSGLESGERDPESLADERVVHALLRGMAPHEAAATMRRVDSAMRALECAERDRFALRVHRVIAPWIARGAAAAALLLMALVITRVATTPSSAYAELAAIASATEAMPFRRYAIVIETSVGPERRSHRHGTLDLGPDERFVVQIAPRADARTNAAVDGGPERLRRPVGSPDRRQRRNVDPSADADADEALGRRRLRPPRERFDPQATFGHDGEYFWLVPTGGPVVVSTSAMMLQGRPEFSEGLDQLILDRVLQRLHDGYRLDRTETEEIDPVTGTPERVIRIVATRVVERRESHGRADDRAERAERTGRANRQRLDGVGSGRASSSEQVGRMPSMVVIRARSADRVVMAFEAQWSASDPDGPRRRIAIELLEEGPPATFSDLSWFGHASHHATDWPVIEIDGEDLMSMRQRRQSRDPSAIDAD